MLFRSILELGFPLAVHSRRGAALWARVTPGAWGAVTDEGGWGIQSPLGSLLIHSAKLIPLEPPAKPSSEPSVPSQGVPCSDPPRGETERQVTSGHHPVFVRRDEAGVLLSSLRARQRFFLPQGEPGPDCASQGLLEARRPGPFPPSIPGSRPQKQKQVPARLQPSPHRGAALRTSTRGARARTARD